MLIVQTEFSTGYKYQTTVIDLSNDFNDHYISITVLVFNKVNI